MTKDKKDEIIKALLDEKKEYVIDCKKQKTLEEGKIIGANYMVQTLIDVFFG